MERLTYKNYIDEWEVKFEKTNQKQWSIAESDTHIKITGEPIDKLAELEDLMEIEGFDSIEHLQRFVFEYRAENEELKNHTKELNDKLLNLQLFLKDLRDGFHEDDETYKEIDKKLKELGENE